MRLSPPEEPVRKRSNSQPIQLNFYLSDDDIASPPRPNRPSSCSLLSSPVAGGFHDIIHTSVRLSCASSSPDDNDISPPLMKKHQKRLRLSHNPVTTTPLRCSLRDSAAHSTPINQINALRLSGNFATPQDALKWCRKKFFRYPDREDEWNVSVKATDDALKSFWKVFYRNKPARSINLICHLAPSTLANIFSYLEKFERLSVQLVCRHWSLSFHYLLTQEVCTLPTDLDFNLEGVPVVNQTSWRTDFTDYFTEVSLVGDGTSKKVYSLLLDPTNVGDLTPKSTTPLACDLPTTMATLTLSKNPVVVSVMDLEDLYSRDVTREAIEAELQISLLSSSLYSLRICPCLLQTHFLFRSDQLLHENADYKTRHKRQKGNRRKSQILRDQRAVGKYLYIGMEKCNGNLEEYLEETSHQSKDYSVTSILVVFFQLCYALYVCREKMSLVHYDLKLLNCLYSLAEVASPGEEIKTKKNLKKKSKSSEFNEEIITRDMKVGFDDRLYSLPLSTPDHSTCGILKLIDFGTSVMNSKYLGKPIQFQQVR